MRPPREAVERQVIARKAPPPAQRPFEAREPQLQRTPGRAPEVSPAEAAPDRKADTVRKVRVVEDNRRAVDVRETAPPATLQPLDRSVEPTSKGRGRARSRDEVDGRKPAQPDEQRRSERQDPAAQQQGLELERRLAECEAAAEQQGGSRVQAAKARCRQEFDRASREIADATREDR